MRFTCAAEKLGHAISVATKALANRTTNQILEGIRIETGEDEVIFTCSDERITIVTRIEAQIEEHGSGVVPGKLFSEFVRRLPHGDAVISMNKHFQFSIKSGSFRTNISGQDSALFPRLPKMDGETEILLPQDMLRQMIQKTEFAIAQEDMREVLTGCYMEMMGGMLTMVALDGFRLALCRNICSDVLDKFSAIVPGKAISEIGKLLQSDEEAFTTLSFAGNRLHIRLGDTEIFVILINGEYVQYKQILPTSFATRVIVPLDPFKRALDRASLIAREGSSNLVTLTVDGNLLTVEAHSQIGDAVEEMDVENQGSDMYISFNVKYLTDVVRTIDTEKIELCMNNAVSPCVITPLNDNNYVHLVLPVRTGGGR